MTARMSRAAHRRFIQLLAVSCLLVTSLAHVTSTAPSAGGGGSKPCWYTVEIKTSCSSPRRTSDDVSLAFGDMYHNEVYARRLNGGAATMFERCAKDTFRVGGPCGYGVCYLYLRRKGREGWTPEWVKVYEPTTAGGSPSTFYYGSPLPNAVWYGFNRCPRANAPQTKTSNA